MDIIALEPEVHVREPVAPMSEVFELGLPNYDLRVLLMWRAEIKRLRHSDPFEERQAIDFLLRRPLRTVC